MRNGDVEKIAGWLTEQALAGASETALLCGFCERTNSAGLPLSSAIAVVDTLHPIWQGRAFFWRNDGQEEEPVVEYRSTREGEGADVWKKTAFYHLIRTGAPEVRRRIGFGDPVDFYGLDELRNHGHKDYLALIQRFASEATIGQMDAIFSHWTTQHPRGFSKAHCSALRRLVPTLALGLKSISLSRIAETLVEVYLGKDAGRRVLRGSIRRGTTERINAALWFSDLRGYTSLADWIEPSEIIPLLNDYAEMVISAVHAEGGDVLKLVGDGILAIFQSPDGTSCALRAARGLKRHSMELNARRQSEGRPVTIVRLGLHVGDVLYGNIGGEERLDFTVVGPAVNEVSRIVSMCRSADRDLLASAEFVAASSPDDQMQFASAGRFALRGVRRPQELFTVFWDDEEPASQSSGRTKSGEEDNAGVPAGASSSSSG
ncbi:MAG: adenylate/guanylate cyclase domain-containing protein [Terrimicrobiaceae bacterium]